MKPKFLAYMIYNLETEEYLVDAEVGETIKQTWSKEGDDGVRIKDFELAKNLATVLGRQVTMVSLYQVENGYLIEKDI